MHFTLNYNLSATSSCRSLPPPNIFNHIMRSGPTVISSREPGGPEVLGNIIRTPYAYSPRAPEDCPAFNCAALIFFNSQRHICVACLGLMCWEHISTLPPGQPRSPPDGEEACRKVQIDISGWLDGVQSLGK